MVDSFIGEIPGRNLMGEPNIIEFITTNSNSVASHYIYVKCDEHSVKDCRCHQSCDLSCCRLSKIQQLLRMSKYPLTFHIDSNMYLANQTSLAGAEPTTQSINGCINIRNCNRNCPENIVWHYVHGERGDAKTSP